MAFGYIDTQYVDLPAGLDEGYLRGLTTRGGRSVAEMIQAVDTAMGAINDGADPLIAALSYQTANPVAGVRGTGTKVVRRAGEYTPGRPQQIGARVGHLLPIGKFEVDLGFTEDGLEEISDEAFGDELDAMVEAFRRFHLAEVLTRLTSAAEVTVDQGVAVTSPGFAGSGTGTNVFSGQYPDGTDLPGGYTHYAYSTPANMATMLATYIARLQRWHAPPFDLVASNAFLTDLTALPLFTAAGSTLVRPAAANAEALVDPAVYVGVYAGLVRVRAAHNALGTGKHGAIWKDYGNFDPRNPIAWRYDPLRGPGAVVRSRALYPLADAIALQWAGFGAGDRSNAILLYVDTAPGSYVAPTISIA